MEIDGTEEEINVICYVRVITEEQGDSCLGLDAQRASMEEYCLTHGYKVIQWTEEIASARGSS